MRYFPTIWDGNVARVRTARNKLLQSGSWTSYFDYVSGLYSFRRIIPWYGPKLRDLLKQSAEFTREFLLGLDPDDPKKQIEVADWCDIYSTALERYSGTDERYLGWAIDIYWIGRSLAEPFIEDPKHAHTAFLLAVRYARICIKRDKHRRAREMLDDVARYLAMPGIVADPNQLARLYVQMGLLYRKIAERNQEAREFAARAVRVPGIGKFTLAKAYAARIGLDL